VTSLRQYIAEEIATDHVDGLLSRREALRRLALLGLGSGAAAALIAACGKQPQRLIADRGYDSNAVRALLVKRGIDPIIPARCNNTAATHQDGRKLRRYRRRWIVQRTHSWLQRFRRLVVRYERSAVVFLGLVHIACALVTLRRVLG